MKNFIQYKYIYYFLLPLAVLTSCVDNLNSDPNRPTEVPTSSLLLASEKLCMDNLRSENISLKVSMLFPQYFTETYYSTYSRYNTSHYFSDEYWGKMYQVLNNLEEIIRLNSDPAAQRRGSVSKEGRNQSQIAICRTMKTYVYHTLTDVFGSIPYESYGSKDPDFEALQQESVNVTPRYASQQKIYIDMLNELQAAADTLLKYKNEFTLVTGDVLYKGSNEQWAKFANSLRLRLATHIKAKEGDLYRKHFSDALQKGVFTSNADNAVFSYLPEAPNEAPFYAFVASQGRDDFAVSHVFINLLKGENPQLLLPDPRLPIYAIPNNQNEYVGMPYGTPEKDTQNFPIQSISLPGRMVRAADYKEVFIEYAEVAFLISEYEGWSQAKYEEGVRASLEKWGVAANDAANYIKKLPKANQRNVMNQKYIALYTQGLEAWTEYRRTGYPDFLIKAGDTIAWINGTPLKFDPLAGDGSIPKRMIYPKKEQNLNRENYRHALIVQGGDDITTPLWFFK